MDQPGKDTHRSNLTDSNFKQRLQQVYMCPGCTQASDGILALDHDISENRRRPLVVAQHQRGAHHAHRAEGHGCACHPGRDLHSEESSEQHSPSPRLSMLAVDTQSLGEAVHAGALHGYTWARARAEQEGRAAPLAGQAAASPACVCRGRTPPPRRGS